MLFIELHGDHRDIHSFPTRRSSNLSCTFYGMMMDKFAMGKVLVIGCSIAAIMIAIFYLSLENANLLFITYFLAGFSVGIVGSFAYFMVKVFPTQVRYSGVSFSFNMAYAIAGGLTPLLISFFSDFVSKMAPAIYVVGLFVLGALRSEERRVGYVCISLV